MLRRLAILLPLLVSTVAHAAGPGARAVGTFEHQEDGYEQGVEVKAAGAAGFTAQFSTGTKGCGGEVTMKGRPTGPDTIVFRKTDGGQTCRITARYASDFRSVVLEEQGCTMWHGASCEFQGTLKRTGR
ncbi:hypothetical protein SAMN02799625_00202 [Methylobacterium sp. UNC300MFChir4.1]|nr:hypothetical protein SAMN02799625_00202 [Methylobacterium sp. UNC300MFChir4.1]